MRSKAIQVIPAVDLRDGACVQLVGGSYAEERVRLDDPETVVASWLDAGYPNVHVIDLDAATGQGDNDALVAAILTRWPGRVQVGGGVRSTARAEELLTAGAARVLVGTRALEDPEWLRAVVDRHPGRIVPALDVRDRVVLVAGWQRSLPVGLEKVLDTLNVLPLGGVLVTAVHREGALAGPDLDLMYHLRGRTRHRLLAAGGIRGAGDVAALGTAGIEECVVGMAMYTGNFDRQNSTKEEAHT